MKKQIDIWINRAEDLWLKKLNKHASNLFSESFLPSHDQTHHHRVWNICRTLLKEIAAFNTLMDQSLVEGLLVATYFHDLGMVRSTREEHGYLGKEICEIYLKNNSGSLPPRFDEVLVAIERHDDKKAGVTSVIQAGQSPSILELLSVADDLEALGIIGIYRYIEIYLMRDMNLRNLGLRILGNASNRFRNLSNSCIHCPLLMNVYQQQYFELVACFDSYNQQLLNETAAEEVYCGHLGVVNTIRNLGIEMHINPMDFLTKNRNDNTGLFVTNFFTVLKGELEGARQ